MNRDVIAIGLLVAAVVAAPVGAFLVAGLGWAVIVAAVMCFLTAVLVGWA